VPRRIIWSWCTRRWWVGCYIWYSEQGTGRGPNPPRPLLAVPNVIAHPSTASVSITVLLYNGRSVVLRFQCVLNKCYQAQQTLERNKAMTSIVTRPFSFRILQKLDSFNRKLFNCIFPDGIVLNSLPPNPKLCELSYTASSGGYWRHFHSDSEATAQCELFLTAPNKNILTYLLTCLLWRWCFDRKRSLLLRSLFRLSICLSVCNALKLYCIKTEHFFAECIYTTWKAPGSGVKKIAKMFSAVFPLVAV